MPVVSGKELVQRNRRIYLGVICISVNGRHICICNVGIPSDVELLMDLVLGPERMRGSILLLGGAQKFTSPT
jgi:hypothetical protein